MNDITRIAEARAKYCQPSFLKQVKTINNVLVSVKKNSMDKSRYSDI